MLLSLTPCGMPNLSRDKPGQLFLVDSGGQNSGMIGGQTDPTRCLKSRRKPHATGQISSARIGHYAILRLASRSRREGFGILEKTNEHGGASPR